MSDTSLPTLPGDDVRQIMWRFSDRFDLQMAVQSARGVARGTVARLVADGVRNTHEWNDEKGKLLTAFDESGLTSLYMDVEQGGFIEGPKNMAMSLVAFELSWVDAGAATGSLAGNLALAPIHEKGTDEQRRFYMGKALPPQPGEDRVPWRGAFALTEPLPFVGVDTGVVGGKAKIADWPEGGEPVLQIDKRGRFITNMDFANFVTAAVDSDDERIKGTFMVILEETDPGTFDRGAPTLKLVHQLSSTRDPVFSQQVPASRIIGGYDVVDGVIVPKFNHSEVIASVFHRTRIPVGLMTAAKLLSAVEPVIRYQRSRFHGGEAGEGSPRYDLGLQVNEDVTHRLIDVWATGEAAASVGFEAARQADIFDPVEREKDRICAEQGLTGRKQMMALRKKEPEVLEYLDLLYTDEAERDAARFADLDADILVQFALGDARANIMNPAVKLWNTGHGATMMREAVALMGGYGTTEDCPGFLPQKWMDAQLEATYEGPEAVQRRHLTLGMTSRIFRHEVDLWIRELEAQAGDGYGAKSLAAGFKLWSWTTDYLQGHNDPDGKKLYHGKRQAVTFPLADAICWLLSARSLVQDSIELKTKGAENPVLAESLDAFSSFYADLCKLQAARAAGEVSRICADLVYGFQESADEADAAEFAALREAVDRSLAGTELARDRAADALTHIMIPEALDYPA
ncbi:acyl-CoA dehydrogenase family protein [Haloferula sp. A504]|uniref:acyl-CoA dehydrogenase family protein n=1 Tax=Haloferula sp. A504 TaxID=3373601 RepID=UPI0031C56523|nr:acyl-CoA/acyl-ACP dehydrogenase [Verrucomicrobiaceae bacterium E54]